MNSLTKAEQETVILFDEEEKCASVYTYNKRLQRRLSKILESGNPDIRLSTEDGRGGQTYIVPKGWIKVNPKRTLSEERRAQLSEQMKQNR